MNLFNNLFNPNKKKWLGKLTHHRVEEKNDKLIQQFMLVDNIDFEKFVLNNRWENAKNTSFEDSSKLVHCSPTYKKHYSDTYACHTSNVNCEELGFDNNWFVIAYPDVTLWIDQNLEKFILSLSELGIKKNPYDLYDFRPLRHAIESYKTLFGKLELAM